MRLPTMPEAMRRPGFGRGYSVLLVLAIALSACAGTSAERDRSYLYRSDDEYVRLEPIEAGAPDNAHPFVISAGELSRLLGGIEVSRAASIGKARLFLHEELQKIGPHLAAALSRGTPRQDVTFAVTGHRGWFGKLSPESITTGRLFVTGDSLNLILGVVQQRYGIEALDDGAVLPEIIPGKRSRRIDNAVWKIDPDRGRLREQRGDWLVFDRSAIPTAPAAATPAAPQSGAQPGTGAPTTPTIEDKAQEIEKRLGVLDALRKKGAITEEEYRERRRAILEQL